MSGTLRSRRSKVPLEILREAGIQKLGAVVVYGDGSGLFELLLAVSPAREDGDRLDAGLGRRLDVPDGVPDGDDLIRVAAGILQGELEDVRGGFGFLDVTGVDDARDFALGLEPAEILLELLGLGASDESDLVALFGQRS